MRGLIYQFNIAKMKKPYTDPVWDDFKEQLDKIHKEAESCSGFVWRYKGEEDDDGYIMPWKDQPLIMGNLSAWTDYQSLFDFTFSGNHLEIMKRRKKWFDSLPRPWNVLYYSGSEDLRNSSSDVLAKAISRFNLIQRIGQSPFAFNFKRGIE